MSGVGAYRFLFDANRRAVCERGEYAAGIYEYKHVPQVMGGIRPVQPGAGYDAH